MGYVIPPSFSGFALGFSESSHRKTPWSDSWTTWKEQLFYSELFLNFHSCPTKAYSHRWELELRLTAKLRTSPQCSALHNLMDAALIHLLIPSHSHLTQTQHLCTFFTLEGIPEILFYEKNITNRISDNISCCFSFQVQCQLWSTSLTCSAPQLLRSCIDQIARSSNSSTLYSHSHHQRTWWVLCKKHTCILDRPPITPELFHVRMKRQSQNQFWKRMGFKNGLKHLLF